MPESDVKPTQCLTCLNEGKPPHYCPFAAEIHGDDETLCTCCDWCEYRMCEGYLMTLFDFLDKLLYNLGMGLFWLLIIGFICYVIGSYDRGK